MKDYQTTYLRVKHHNVLYSAPAEFDQIKPLIVRIKRGDGYTYTIPGTRLVSLQKMADATTEKIAFAEIEQQFERSGLTIQDIEKQFKDYNDACNRIFR